MMAAVITSHPIQHPSHIGDRPVVADHPLEHLDLGLRLDQQGLGLLLGLELGSPCTGSFGGVGEVGQSQDALGLLGFQLLPPINDTGGELRGELGDDDEGVPLGQEVDLNRLRGRGDNLRCRIFDHSPTGEAFDGDLDVVMPGLDEVRDLLAGHRQDFGLRGGEGEGVHVDRSFSAPVIGEDPRTMKAVRP